eukprot:6213883-Pleurochrysis_carterae.AAC.2
MDTRARERALTEFEHAAAIVAAVTDRVLIDIILCYAVFGLGESDDGGGLDGKAGRNGGRKGGAAGIDDEFAADMLGEARCCELRRQDRQKVRVELLAIRMLLPQAHSNDRGRTKAAAEHPYQVLKG